MANSNPFRIVDDESRQMAEKMIAQARFGALAILQPESLVPSVSRIALATDPEGRPMSLISSLAGHTAALHANPSCALLIGEPGQTGDPLTHPRLTLHTTAQFIGRGTPQHDTLRTHYLQLRPKAKLYVDFTDFSFVVFDVSDGLLNGGFGKAWHLAATDLPPLYRTT